MVSFFIFFFCEYAVLLGVCIVIIVPSSLEFGVDESTSVLLRHLNDSKQGVTTSAKEISHSYQVQFSNLMDSLVLQNIQPSVEKAVLMALEIAESTWTPIYEFNLNFTSSFDSSLSKTIASAKTALSTYWRASMDSEMSLSHLSGLINQSEKNIINIKTLITQLDANITALLNSVAETDAILEDSTKKVIEMQSLVNSTFLETSATDTTIFDVELVFSKSQKSANNVNTLNDTIKNFSQSLIHPITTQSTLLNNELESTYIDHSIHFKEAIQNLLLRKINPEDTVNFAFESLGSQLEMDSSGAFWRLWQQQHDDEYGGNRISNRFFDFLKTHFLVSDVKSSSNGFLNTFGNVGPKNCIFSNQNRSGQGFEPVVVRLGTAIIVSRVGFEHIHPSINPFENNFGIVKKIRFWGLQMDGTWVVLGYGGLQNYPEELRDFIDIKDDEVTVVAVGFEILESDSGMLCGVSIEGTIVTSSVY